MDARVQAMLDKEQELLQSKGQDYAKDTDIFSAFKFVDTIVAHAVDSGMVGEDLSFVTLISTKLARMIELCSSGKVANNESKLDTCVDMANYATLWGAREMERIETFTWNLDDIKNTVAVWAVRYGHEGYSCVTLNFEELVEDYPNESTIVKISEILSSFNKAKSKYHDLPVVLVKYPDGVTRVLDIRKNSTYPVYLCFVEDGHTNNLVSFLAEEYNRYVDEKERGLYASYRRDS